MVEARPERRFISSECDRQVPAIPQVLHSFPYALGPHVVTYSNLLYVRGIGSWRYHRIVCSHHDVQDFLLVGRNDGSSSWEEENRNHSRSLLFYLKFLTEILYRTPSKYQDPNSCPLPLSACRPRCQCKITQECVR